MRTRMRGDATSTAISSRCWTSLHWLAPEGDCEARLRTILVPLLAHAVYELDALSLGDPELLLETGDQSRHARPYAGRQQRADPAAPFPDGEVHATALHVNQAGPFQMASQGVDDDRRGVESEGATKLPNQTEQP